MKQIVFDDVSFKYPQWTADDGPPQLQHLCFSLRLGEAVGLIGANGSGKTTLLQLLAGLEPPTAGEIRFLGENIHADTGRLARYRLEINLVFQFPEMQLFEPTVAEDIAFGPKNLALAEAQIRRRVQEAMRWMDLDFDRFARRYIDALSQGEKRRVAIAGVLAMNPTMLALDEPTAALDPRSQGKLIALLQNLHRGQGTGLVIASHDIDFLLDTVSRLIVLQDGRIAADVSLADLHESETLPQSGIPLSRASRLARRLRELGLSLPTPFLSANQLLHWLEEQEG